MIRVIFIVACLAGIMYCVVKLASFEDLHYKQSNIITVEYTMWTEFGQFRTTFNLHAKTLGEAISMIRDSILKKDTLIEIPNQ